MTEPQDLRDISQQIIASQFPDFQPRNDFDLITLATVKYSGARCKLGTWLDEQLAIAVQDAGSMEAVMNNARAALNISSSRFTGVKPRGTGRNVFLRPIPKSPYSVRLFPGCALAREYCLDFVDSQTGVPVNSPFKFELWAIPDPSGPSHGVGSTRIHNLETAFGLRQDQISPGQEKFLLRDGQTCLLRRPGHKDVRFTVPVRRQPLEVSRGAENVDVLDFPTSIAA